MFPNSPKSVEASLKRGKDYPRKIAREHIGHLMEEVELQIEEERKKAADMQKIITFEQKAKSFLSELKVMKENKSTGEELIRIWTESCPCFETNFPDMKDKDFIYWLLSEPEADLEANAKSLVEDFKRLLTPEREILI